MSPTTRWRLRLTVAAVVVSVSTALFLYPSFTILRLMGEARLRKTGELRQVAPWFRSVARRYAAWADEFLQTDYAAKQHHNAVACSWPTPFGFLIPGLMGKVAVDGWCLGEVALLFSMTRPLGNHITSFQGPVPWIVPALALAYASIGLLFIGLEIRALRRARRAVR